MRELETAQAACCFKCLASKLTPFFQMINVIAAIFLATVRRAIVGFIRATVRSGDFAKVLVHYWDVGRQRDCPARRIGVGGIGIWEIVWSNSEISFWQSFGTLWKISVSRGSLKRNADFR